MPLGYLVIVDTIPKLSYLSPLVIMSSSSDRFMAPPTARNMDPPHAASVDLTAPSGPLRGLGSPGAPFNLSKRSVSNNLETPKLSVASNKLISYVIPSTKDQVCLLPAPFQVNAERMAKLQVLLSVVKSLEPLAERAHISDLIAIFRQHFPMSVDAADGKARQCLDRVIASLRNIEFLRLSSVLDHSGKNVGPKLLKHFEKPSEYSIPKNIMWLEFSCSFAMSQVDEIFNGFDPFILAVSYFLKVDTLLSGPPPSLPVAYDYSDDDSDDSSANSNDGLPIVSAESRTTTTPATMAAVVPEGQSLSLDAQFQSPALTAYALSVRSASAGDVNFAFLDSQDAFHKRFGHQTLLKSRSASSSILSDPDTIKALNRIQFHAFTRHFYRDYIGGNVFDISKSQDETMQHINEFISRIRGSYYDKTSRQSVAIHPQKVFDELNQAATMLIHAGIKKVNFNLCSAFYNTLSADLRSKMYKTGYTSPTSTSRRVLKQLVDMQLCRDAAVRAFEEDQQQERKLNELLNKRNILFPQPHPTPRFGSSQQQPTPSQGSVYAFRGSPSIAELTILKNKNLVSEINGQYYPIRTLRKFQISLLVSLDVLDVALIIVSPNAQGVDLLTFLAVSTRTIMRILLFVTLLLGTTKVLHLAPRVTLRLILRLCHHRPWVVVLIAHLLLG